MMIRKLKISFAVLITFTFSLTQSQEKPNVLFIAIDDLNDYVNCMNGSIQAHTPNIDRLAESGVLFTNAHCQAPICGPSRASIMTGLYPSTSGIYFHIDDKAIQGASKATEQAVLMPDFFERNGYKTMATGKVYHNGDMAATFDEYGGKFAWMGPIPEKNISFHAKKRYGRGGRKFDWGAYPEHDSLMTDYKSAQWAVSKLQQNHDKPFFMAVGFLRPHIPWYVPQKWFDMFPKDKIKTPPYNPEDFEDIPPIAKTISTLPDRPTTEELIETGEWKDVVQAYLACVAFVDAQFGKVLKALEESKYKNNTIIVLWSDHGYHLGEKNRFAKHALWERDTKTNLIFKEPKGLKGKKCNATVQLVDIYPTLAELCGLPKYQQAEGHSLVPFLSNPDTIIKKPALTFYGLGNVSVRNDRYRLIQYEDGSLELYDLIDDPNEWDNIADKPEMQSEVLKMKEVIPENWAPMSKANKYMANDFFIEKMKELE